MSATGEWVVQGTDEAFHTEKTVTWETITKEPVDWATAQVVNAEAVEQYLNVRVVNKRQAGL